MDHLSDVRPSTDFLYVCMNAQINQSTLNKNVI